MKDYGAWLLSGFAIGWLLLLLWAVIWWLGTPAPDLVPMP